MKNWSILFSIFAMLLVISCTQQENKRDLEANSNLKDSISPEEKEKKAEKIKEIFYSLPSPMELSILFKNEGVEYQSEQLHDISQRDRYVTTIKKALNLGVYGADLSYAGLFSNKEDAMKLFATNQYLAESLGIGHTFETEFVTRLEKNADNKDTLLQVISDFFLQNDAYFREYNQVHTSTYVLLGGWIEGLYLGINMISDKSNAKGIRDIIIGQEASLDILINLLNDGGISRELDRIKEHLAYLKEYYSEVATDVSSKNATTTSTSEDGQLVIENNKVETNMQDTTFSKIKTIVAEVRGAILK